MKPEINLFSPYQLNQPDPTTFYGGAQGYTDYPFWSATSEQVISH